MKLPRDVSGNDLGRALKSLGYLPTRQLGSHIWLTTEEKGSHHVTVPKNDSLKLGTLESILDDVAKHRGMARNELLLNLRL